MEDAAPKTCKNPCPQLPSNSCKRTSATACWSSSTWWLFARLACFTSCWKFTEQVTISSGLNLRILLSDGGECAVAAGRIAPGGVMATAWTRLTLLAVAFGRESRSACCCKAAAWCTASWIFAL